MNLSSTLVRWLKNSPDAQRWLRESNWGALYEDCLWQCSTRSVGCLTEVLLSVGVDPMLTMTNFDNRSVPERYGCRVSGLTRVKVPSGISAVGDDAFRACPDLEEVRLPEGIKEIGESAFGDCTKLKAINLPSSVEHILGRAFQRSGLKKIVWPSSAQTISERCFSGCSALEEIEIPEGVFGIENYAFENCSSLGSLALPKSIGWVDASAFPEHLRDIKYAGTKEQWQTDVRFYGYCEPGVTIHCADGEVSVS